MRTTSRPMSAGLSCLVCGANVDIATPFSWRCPNATALDPHHALEFVEAAADLHRAPGHNPFEVFRPHLAWDSFAAANGMTEPARRALLADVDARIASVAGSGFTITPFGRSAPLSDELGFTAEGGVWVKDETVQVGGSHKARHLMSILLHLLTAETLGLAPWEAPADRPALAIASCGNAAIAAATLSAAVNWPIRVFVPHDGDPAVMDLLTQLAATIVTCPRVSSDPPGDPCVHRFREAVAAGAVPFSVQGPDNAWCLDGGRTIGWEMADQFADDEFAGELDRVFVQVGGGALAGCMAAGMSAGGRNPRLHAVQTTSSAPLERTWSKVAERSDLAGIGREWEQLMWPWEHVGASAADGILDDETYDWIPLVGAMKRSGGSVVVVDEPMVVRAAEVARRTTGIDASATGTAGLAGLLELGDQVGRDERVGIIISGIRR